MTLPCNLLQTALLFHLLALTAYFDYRFHRIPNFLTVLSFLTGFLLHQNKVIYLTCFFSTLLVLSLLCSRTGAGGGDAKLLAILFAWLPWEAAARLLLPGCILALIFLLQEKHFLSSLSTGTDSSRCLLFRMRDTPQAKVPLGTMLFLGALPFLFSSVFPFPCFPFPCFPFLHAFP